MEAPSKLLPPIRQQLLQFGFEFSRPLLRPCPVLSRSRLFRLATLLWGNAKSILKISGRLSATGFRIRIDAVSSRSNGSSHDLVLVTDFKSHLARYSVISEAKARPTGGPRGATDTAVRAQLAFVVLGGGGMARPCRAGAPAQVLAHSQEPEWARFGVVGVARDGENETNCSNGDGWGYDRL